MDRRGLLAITRHGITSELAWGRYLPPPSENNMPAPTAVKGTNQPSAAKFEERRQKRKLTQKNKSPEKKLVSRSFVQSGLSLIHI